MQRARMAARCQWPKLMIIQSEESSENVDKAALAESLTTAGIALKSTAQAWPGASTVCSRCVPHRCLFALVVCLIAV